MKLSYSVLNSVLFVQFHWDVIIIFFFYLKHRFPNQTGLIIPVAREWMDSWSETEVEGTILRCNGGRNNRSGFLQCIFLKKTIEKTFMWFFSWDLMHLSRAWHSYHVFTESCESYSYRMLIIFRELTEENVSNMTTNILKIAAFHWSSTESGGLRSDRFFIGYENDLHVGSGLFVVLFAVLLKQQKPWDSILEESLCGGASHLVFLFGPISAIFN